MKITPRQALILVLLLAAALRLPNLYDMPFWEFDEGYNLAYAWNLSEGRLLWFDIRYPYVPHPPLFYVALAAIIKIFGYTLYPARVFAVILSLCTTTLLYMIGSRLIDKKTGLLAAFLYAVYPHAVFWGRMNYNNNLIALMITLSFYLYLLSGRWRTLSYAVMGLSVITEFNGISLAITAFLLGVLFERKSLPRNMAIVLAPAMVFSLVMLQIMPAYFIHDLGYQFKRFGFSPVVFLGSGLILAVFYAFADKLPSAYRMSRDFLRREATILFAEYDSIAWNSGPMILVSAVHFYASRWLFHDFYDGYFIGSFEYYWLMIVGWLLIKDAAKRNITLLFTVPMLIVTLKIGRFDHMCIPLYPLFSLGGSVLLQELYSFLRKLALLLTNNKTLALCFSAILLAYPFAYVAYADFDTFVMGRRISREDVKSMIDAAEYVNNRTNKEDLVLTSSHLVRYISPANASIFIQGIAIHTPIAYYPALPPERFVYNISYRNAKYIVIPGNDGLAWLANEENGSFRNISREISAWSVEKEIGAYYIYRNPAK